MALNAVIGALRATLGLDSAQFDAGIDRAQKSLGDFGKKAGIAFAAAAASAGAAAIALGVAVKKSADAADEMSKMAAKAGTSVEALSRLNHAANLSGVSLEALVGSLRKLSQNMFDVASGAGATARTAFDALGISVENADGTLRSSVDVLGEVADRFSRLEDGATKTAIASQLFGRAGMELIPLLNSGADGLAEMAAEADRLGLTFSTRSAKAAEQFNDNLTRLQGVLQGTTNRIMEAVIPALAELTNTLADPEMQQSIATFAQVAVGALNAIANGARQAGTAVGVLRDLMRDVEDRTMIRPLQNQLADILNRRMQLQAEIAKTESGINIPFITDHALKSAREELARLGEEALVYQERIAQLLGKPRDGAASSQSSAAAPPSLLPPIIPGSIAQIDEAAEAMRRLKEEGLALEMGLKGPFELMQFELDRLGHLLNKGAIDFQTFGEAAHRVRMNTAGEVLGMVGEISGALGSLFKDNKAFAIANAAINVAEGVTKALAQGGIWGFAGAAAVAASGFAQIHSIMQAQPGSASAPSVGGGAAEAAAPAAAAPRQIGGTITLYGDSFGADQIAQLGNGLAEWINADGGANLILAIQRGMR